ncbi:DUF488 domain-containing protein [Aurantimonas marina]|uniref:DUF488 domain-containing protein n=1 Tax=Aurantimonas marina TaxID=2780508 RepID=UPI0019D0353D|nr:DUF488 domain-containing protein [Aurantimonas marina]
MADQLFTIGYEGVSIESFLESLGYAGVDLLIDVRDVPISRKRGFSKKALSDRLAEKSIEYLHLKGLGDPKPGREAARAGRYGEFRAIFADHLRSDRAQADMRKCIEVASGRTATLLCFEKHHENCHRSIVANHLAREGGFNIVHIAVVEDRGKSRPVAGRANGGASR